MKELFPLLIGVSGESSDEDYFPSFVYLVCQSGDFDLRH